MSAPWQRLYNKNRWRRLRLAHLSRQPLCVYCLQTGIHNDGTRTPEGLPQPNPNKRRLVVDHIKPHHGDERLFWDAENLQTLCAHHHYADKQDAERRGYSKRIGVSGWPSDPKHPIYHRHEHPIA